MANTSSAKKAVRSSEKKRYHNLGWKKRIKTSLRNLMDLIKNQASKEDLNKSLSQVQKVLDKASKEKVIHKNKADRLKSRIFKKASLNNDKPTATKPKKTKSK